MIPRPPACSAGLIAVALTLSGVVFPADDPAGPEQPQPTALTERVAVRLAQVSIVATDRRGNPVTDLTAEEIVVRDRRQRRQVAYLEPVVPPGEQADLAETLLFVELPGGPPNGLVVSSGAREYVAFFVDVENDDPLRRSESLVSLVEYAQQVSAGTMAAVFAYDGELYLEASFTSDRDALVAAINRAWSRHGRPRVDLRARVDQLIDKFDGCVVSGGELSEVIGSERCIEAVVHEYTEEVRPFVQSYVDALLAMMRIVSGVEGRKTIIALSHGVAIDPMTEIIEAASAVFGTGEQMGRIQLYGGFGDMPRVTADRLTEMALENDVTLHVVDHSRAPAGDAGARRGHMLKPGARPMLVAFTAAQDDARELAAATGGRFFAAPDLESGLAQVHAAQRGTYELGYYLDERPTRAQLAKVTIDTTRKGVQVSHPRSRFARATAATLPGRIVLSAAAPGSRAGRSRYEFKIGVEPRSLGYRVTDDEASASLSVHVRVLDLQERRLAESFHFLQHSYPRSLWEAQTIGALTFAGWVEVPPGAYRLELALWNIETRQGGELLTAFEVVAPEQPASAVPSVSAPVQPDGTASAGPTPDGSADAKVPDPGPFAAPPAQIDDAPKKEPHGLDHRP